MNNELAITSIAVQGTNLVLVAVVPAGPGAGDAGNAADARCPVGSGWGRWMFRQAAGE